MPTYDLRIVYEAGHDPVTNEPIGRDEEVVSVEGPSPWEARSRALATVTRIRPMGRLVRTYDVATGQEVKPPSPGELRSGRFRIDGLDGTYDGFTRGEKWNGFAVPYFPLAEARRIASDFAAQPPSLDGQALGEYDADRDVVRLRDPSSEDWDETPRVEVDGRPLYPVGARLWTWEEASVASPGHVGQRSSAN